MSPFAVDTGIAGKVAMMKIEEMGLTGGALDEFIRKMNMIHSNRKELMYRLRQDKERNN